MIKNIQHIVGFKTNDGFHIDAVLLTGGLEDDILNRPVILQIHGVLGHFLARGTPRLIPPAMLKYGISTLSVNTRLAFMGQILGLGNFEYAAQDIVASVEYLKDYGFKNIFILGYSLGANLAVHYLANNPEPRIKGVILEGCSFSLPDSQRNRYNKWDSIPSYDNIYKYAKEALGHDPHGSPNDQVFIVYRAWGSTFNPLDAELFTYKTWWFMRSPEAENAKTYRIVGRIKQPIYFIQGEEDYIVEEWEPRVLSRIAKRSANDSVRLQFIPDARHDCMENPDFTIRKILEWIADISTDFGYPKAKIFT